MKANITVKQEIIEDNLFTPSNLLQLKSNPNIIVLVLRRGLLLNDDKSELFRGMFLSTVTQTVYLITSMAKSNFEQFNGTIELSTIKN